MWIRLPFVPVIVRVYVPTGVVPEVVTVSVELPEPPEIDVGLNVPVVPEGKPLTVKATAPVNPFTAVAVAL